MPNCTTDAPTRWLPAAEVAERLNVPVEALRLVVEDDLWHGRIKTVGIETLFSPDAVAFVRWWSELTDAVIAGDVSVFEAERLVRRRKLAVTAPAAAPRLRAAGASR